MCAQSLQSCLTLCDPMDCSPPGSYCPWDSPGKNTRVGFHALLQGIFLTQGLNMCFLHCWWILYPLSQLGSQILVYSTTKNIYIYGLGYLQILFFKPRKSHILIFFYPFYLVPESLQIHPLFSGTVSEDLLE